MGFPALMNRLFTTIYRTRVLIRPWQTRTHCCGHIVADTNVSPFARGRNICCGHKFCVRDTKNVFDFVKKHVVSATNVSLFAQLKKHHGQQCVRNKVSSFTRAFTERGNASQTGAYLLVMQKLVESASREKSAGGFSF